MSEEEHTHWSGEKNEELYGSFVDLFSCPLCQHKPLTINEAYFDDAFNAVFALFCEICGGVIEYFVGGDTIDETREKLARARVLGVTSLVSKPSAATSSCLSNSPSQIKGRLHTDKGIGGAAHQFNETICKLKKIIDRESNTGNNHHLVR